MGSEIVAEGEILSPQDTALLDQMHVVRPRVPAAKIVSSRNALLTSILVAGSLEGADVIVE
jgi:hypothetical protein